MSRKIISGDFNDQPIPSNYYDFLNNDDDNGNNIPFTPIYGFLPYNKGMEDASMQNDEDIDNEIIMDIDDSLTLAIHIHQNETMKIEGVDTKTKEGNFKEWERKMKKWNQKIK